MMLPCRETYKRMVGAQCGVWAELVNDGSIELAVKLSADLTKAVLKGAPVTLLVAVIRVEDNNVRIVGVRVEDDKSDPVYPHGPQEVLREQENFEKLLKLESTFVTFFDELVRPVMAGRVRWNAQNGNIILDYLNNTLPHYRGNHRPLLVEAMDLAEKGLSKWHLNDGSTEAQLWKGIPLQFENLHPIEVGSLEVGTFMLDDPDELDKNREIDAGRIFTIFKDALKKRRFTGRCEYFQEIGLLEGEKFCWMGLGLQWQREVDPIPSYDWWVEFREEVRPWLDAEPGLALTHLSEMGRLGDIRASQTLFIIIEFMDGKVVGFLEPDIPNDDEL